MGKIRREMLKAQSTKKNQHPFSHTGSQCLFGEGSVRELSSVSLYHRDQKKGSLYDALQVSEEINGG